MQPPGQDRPPADDRLTDEPTGSSPARPRLPADLSLEDELAIRAQPVRELATAAPQVASPTERSDQLRRRLDDIGVVVGRAGPGFNLKLGRRHGQRSL